MTPEKLAEIEEYRKTMGIREAAKKAGTTLAVGEFIVFINRKKCALKLFAAGNTVAHFKMPGSQQMNMSVIGLIPRFFNGKELRYDDAIAEIIKKRIRQ